LVTLSAIAPLGRRPKDAQSGNDVEVYRDQLDEIDRDLKVGLIGAAEAEAAHIEVSRRLIAAAEMAGMTTVAQDDAGHVAAAAAKSRRAVASRRRRPHGVFVSSWAWWR
jgi:cytochrome c-type biogenesis protein CcmI